MSDPLVERVHPEMQPPSTDIEFWLTLAGAVAAIGLFFFARWRAAKPAEPLKTRLVDFTIVQFAAIVALLVMVVHLMSLGSGQRFKGRFGAVVPTAIEEDRA